MALANYLPSCAKNTPGNRPEFYIAPSGTITALAETASEISTLTAAISSFFRVKSDLDTLQFTQEGSFSTSGAYTQNLIAKFSKPSAALSILIDEVVAQLPCGLELLWVDGNAKVWLAGASLTTKEGSSRPFNKMTTSLDSGVAQTDEGMNADTLTFTRTSGFRPVQLDATLSAAVLAKTATYIKWI